MKHRIISMLILTALIITLLPLSVLSGNTAEESGECGDALKWSFNKDSGTLTISGTGEMYDFGSYWTGESSAPWFNKHEQIKTLVIENGVSTIGESAFEGCENLFSATIPESVTKIGDSAFGYCKNLAEISIPDSVTVIGSHAFEYCTGLPDITIPDGVSRINPWCFKGCSSLSVVTLGCSVNSVGVMAFTDCDRLKAIFFKGDRPALDYSEVDVFQDSITLFYLENMVGWAEWPSHEYEGNPIEIWKPDLHIHSYSAEIVGYICVEQCHTVYTCGCGDSFNGNYRDAIGHSYGENGLCTRCVVSYPVDGGNLYFQMSTGEILCADDTVSNVIIPAEINGVAVTGIHKDAFYGCYNLTNVTIPNSVTDIGERAFAACFELTEICVAEDNLQYCSDEYGVLFSKDKSKLIQAPGGILGVYDIPDGVMSIGQEAFNSTKLTSVTIPETVISIGDWAFFGCDELSSVFFLGNAPELGINVFKTFDSMTYEKVNITGLVLYYIANKTGWSTPTWNGYPTATWDGVNIPHIHSYQAVVTAPTCTEKGFTTHTCKCGDSYIDTYVDAIGHQYENGVCVRCGEKDPNAQKPVEFVDVPKDEWYVGAVDYAVRNGLMGGTSANTFEPESAMTRAMLVTVLWRYEGKPMGYQNTFSDVNAKNGSWYIDAVAWAAANGIVGGVGNNKFDPDGNITREQMATILYRYAKKKGIDTGKRGDLSAFPDGGKVESWAKDAVQWTVAEKIIGGSEGYLLPQGNATRAQVATILMRFIENIVKK